MKKKIIEYAVGLMERFSGMTENTCAIEVNKLRCFIMQQLSEHEGWEKDVFDEYEKRMVFPLNGEMTLGKGFICKNGTHENK